MHTVELLEYALDLADRLGYTVRQEWLGGLAGGGCELRGRKILFLHYTRDVFNNNDGIIDDRSYGQDQTK